MSRRTWATCAQTKFIDTSQRRACQKKLFQRPTRSVNGMEPIGYEPETRRLEELHGLRKHADEEAQTEFGPALGLVEVGDVAD
jgi:hypothetical protein